MSYGYALTPDKRLCDYNMEAQGDILADYFLVAFRNSQHIMNAIKYRRAPDVLSALEMTLTDFLSDPKSKQNLPKTTD